MDDIIMNIQKITAALNWINAELLKYPAEITKIEKKGLFSKK
jgi:hypothetical protein